eukprot:TRINITY_DN4898_c0_g1_i1.p2 TRINITY_DN4898_c0_g1~~TRINITY_DN4898_c0_g1_i1.p2  ORF type:complete len:285 (-),score=54.08 TRINITY_DN4898_c0_g1_i1:1012-1866(-)
MAHLKEAKGQLAFMQGLAKKLGFSKPEDWYNVARRDFIEHGGRSLLKQYGDSPSKVITSIFSDVQWNPALFSTVPHRHWQKQEHRRSFMESLRRRFGIDNRVEKSRKEWANVTKETIRQNGGDGLLARSGRSLGKLLEDIYPEYDWSFIENKSASMPEQHLKEILGRYFSDLEVRFRHPDLVHSRSNVKMELDFWIPSHRLAVEYQGKQHYIQDDAASLSLQQQRDQEKRDACKQHNITLVEIPYWWNEKNEEQIFSLINEKRPDIKFSEVQVGAKKVRRANAF